MLVHLFLPQKELLPVQGTVLGTEVATGACTRPHWGEGVRGLYKLASKLRPFERVDGSNNYVHISYEPRRVP